MAPTLSVSNIAWPPDAHDAGISALQGLGITAVEIAPFNVFQTWDFDFNQVRDLRSRLDDAGIACPALQGIAFNVAGAHLFQSLESRMLLGSHLRRIARMAGLLGARACVFGAPKLRDPGDLEPQAAFASAAEFLRDIATAFADAGSALAFEPNARAYACAFVTTTAEGMELVSQVGEPGVKLQIDTGTVFLEAEDPLILEQAAPFAVHAHISEPALAPIGSSGLDHAPLALALKAGGYQGSISIEMKATETWLDAVDRAVAFARKVYLT